MENGRPPKRRKELRKRKRKNQVKVENSSWTYLFLLSTDESLGSVAIHLVQPPFFLSWQSNDSKDTGKRKGQASMASSSFILCAQCAICFRSLPLTRGVLLLLLSYLYFSLSLSLSDFLGCVCQYLLLFFVVSQPGWRQEVGAKVVCHFGRLFLFSDILFPPSSPFLVRSIRSFPHASCQTKMESSSEELLLQFFYLPTSSSRSANDGLIIQTSSLSICLQTKEYLIFCHPSSLVFLTWKKKIKNSSTRRKQPKV